MKILSNYDVVMNLMKIIKDSTPETTKGAQKFVNSTKNILKEFTVSDPMVQFQVKPFPVNLKTNGLTCGYRAINFAGEFFYFRERVLIFPKRIKRRTENQHAFTPR